MPTGSTWRKQLLFPSHALFLFVQDLDQTENTKHSYFSSSVIHHQNILIDSKQVKCRSKKLLDSTRHLNILIKDGQKQVLDKMPSPSHQPSQVSTEALFSQFSDATVQSIVQHCMGMAEVEIKAPEKYKTTVLPKLQEQFLNIRLSCKKMEVAARKYREKIKQSPVIGPFHPLQTILTLRAVECHQRDATSGFLPEFGSDTLWKTVLNTQVCRKEFRFLKLEIRDLNDKGIWARSSRSQNDDIELRTGEMHHLLVTFAHQFREVKEVNIDLIMGKNEVCKGLGWLEKCVPRWEQNLRQKMPLVSGKSGGRFPRLTVTWNGGPLPEKEKEPQSEKGKASLPFSEKKREAPLPLYSEKEEEDLLTLYVEKEASLPLYSEKKEEAPLPLYYEMKEEAPLPLYSEKKEEYPLLVHSEKKEGPLSPLSEKREKRLVRTLRRNKMKLRLSG